MSRGTKRTRDEADVGPADDDDFGPPRPSDVDETSDAHNNNNAHDEEQPKKKQKIVKFEKLYLDLLPSAELYERSYMHRDVLSHIVVSKTDFIITASVDGHVKFWKKQPLGIEFVKHFLSHTGSVMYYASNIDILWRIFLASG
jgi:peptidylprolyl isomerase domain and WD repeat-containing protein 1